MRNKDQWEKAAQDYADRDGLAAVIAKAYRDGAAGVSEYVCAGDPVYLVFIAVSLLAEAADRLDIPAERLDPLIARIRQELAGAAAGKE